MNGPNDPAKAHVFAPTPARQPPVRRTEPSATPAEATREAAAPKDEAMPVHRFAALLVNAWPSPGADALAQRLDRFAFDSDAPTAGHLKAIEAMTASIVAQLRQAGPDATVTLSVTGHTDAAGTERYNEGLGARRATHVQAALQAALARAGVGPARIAASVPRSAGELEPAVRTKDGVREPGNRRVEILATIAGRKSTASYDPLPQEQRAHPLELPPELRPPPPGFLPVAAPTPADRVPPGPRPSQEWLEGYFRNDSILRKLPPKLRDQLIVPLKDLDEITTDQIVQMLPIPHKEAVSATVKGLLKTLKGRKLTIPPPPVQPDFPPEHAPQHMPGEVLLTTPKLPLPKLFN